MNKTVADDEDVIRMNVYVFKDEHPLLYAEMQKFAKGVKRIQRLKTLASERLLLDAGPFLNGRPSPLRHQHQPGPVESHGQQEAITVQKQQTTLTADGEALAAVNELFAPPIKE